MPMLNPRVISVKAADDYTLHLTFSNGEEGVFDCKPYLHKGVFQELQDVRYFGMVKAWKEAGTIHWPNGQDFCPDTLYLASVKAAPTTTPNPSFEQLYVR